MERLCEILNFSEQVAQDPRLYIFSCSIVGILSFMSMINFALSRVEHEKSFITSGQERVS